jgi:methyltransferase (TIGR00027 family)
MKVGHASSTAHAGAAVRAIESLLPEGSRLFEDPFARKFLPKRWHHALVFFCSISQSFRNFVEKFLDRKYPGVPANFICRTVFIDHAILTADREDPFDRLAIVGAGYDSRSLRLALRPEIEIVEIDHPSTQKRKQAIASDLLPPTRSVTWLPHDFSQDPQTSPALKALPNQKTFWLLEGLIVYLPPAALASLFRWIQAHSARGSQIIFTYVEIPKVDPKILKDVIQRGEPFLSSWSADEMRTACESWGIQIIEDVADSECVTRYLHSRGRSLKSVNGFRIAHGVWR